jgi:acetylornithine deacetylase/succinyl-diaminopimelate desuccinylase family protein
VADGTTTSIRDAVHNAVLEGRDEQIELLRSLVGFASENPNLLTDPYARAIAAEQETACQRAIAGHLESLGMGVDLWEVLPGRVDVVGRLPDAGSRGRSVILNGHVDVVPAGAPEGWPHAPWSGEIVDGRMWGRGTSDMKGGIVAAIGALRALQRAGIRVAGDVVFESVVDEEVGGPGTREAIARGYRADAAVVLEPTSGKLVPVEGGLEWLNLIVTGVAGHSAVRYRSIHAGGQGTAVNAIEKAAKLLAAVQEYERYRGNTKVHPLLPAGITTINPGMIAGGSGGSVDGMPKTTKAYSNMADYCVIGLSLKYLPTEKAEDVKREFEEFIATVSAADPWLRSHQPSIEWAANGVAFPPCDTPLDHPFLEAIERASREVTGKADWAGFEAVTDLAWLVEADIPGLIYGPGSIDQAHGASEYIDLGELATSTEVLALTIADWCGAS